MRLREEMPMDIDWNASLVRQHEILFRDRFALFAGDAEWLRAGYRKRRGNAAGGVP
jgi:hypothetical protein